MFWKQSCFAVFVLSAALFALPASAQLGAQDLPDLSGLADAITKSAALPPAQAGDTRFRSGLTVPSIHPGEAAAAIGRQLRQATERQTGPNPAMQKLEAGMPGLLSALEAQLETKGFAKRDLGVAAGVFFAENWQTATGRTLSDPTEVVVVRAVGKAAAQKWRARYASLTPAAREKTYESLLVSTTLLSVFAQTFDKAGKTQAASGIRQTAGSLFQKVVGTAPSQVAISSSGRITGLAPSDKTLSQNSPPVGSVRAAPRGPGLKPSQIAGVYAQPSYGGGVGGFISVSYEPVLALKDGTYCGGFEVPASDLDPAASRRAHPQQWGRWRGSGQHIQTQNKKGIWEKSGWIGPLPSPPPRLSGKYTRVSGGGTMAAGGDVMVAFQDEFTFFPDGRFRSGSTTSASSSAVVAGSSRRTDGTYKISGYAITLRFTDGSVRRWSYARTADGLLFLHGDAYTTDDK